MGEVIRDWITQKLGIIIDLYNVKFSSKAQDGSLLAMVLKSCGVISKEQFRYIKKTTDPEIAFENYNKYIRTWLKDIDIHVEETEIREIANGEGSTALNLFYKIYLKLLYKDVIEFEMFKKYREVKQPGNSRFKVTRTIEPKVEEVPRLNSIVTKNWDVLNWHKDKIVALTKKIDQKKIEYIEYLHTKAIQGSNQTFLSSNIREVDSSKSINDELHDYPEQPDLSYDELIKEQIMARNMPLINCNISPENVQDTQKMVHYTTRFVSNEQKELEQKKMLQYLRDILYENELCDLKLCISTQRLSCSTFEQECISLMCEVKNRKENLLGCKRVVNRQFERDLENDRENILLLQAKQLEDAQNNYYFEKDRLEELYDRISQAKDDFQSNENIQLCTGVVEDMLDYVESISILHENFTWPVLIDFMQGLHKSLFLKCKTIPTVYLPFEDILFYDPKYNDSLNSLYAKEMERQQALNEAEFEFFFNYYGFYGEILEEFLKTMPKDTAHVQNCATKILVFMVRKLLLCKYPIEMPNIDPIINKPIISVCVNGIYDFTILPILKTLLKSNGIEIIQVQDVVNYCIKAYQGFLNSTNTNVAKEFGEKTTSDQAIEESDSFIKDCLPQLNKDTGSEDSSSKGNTSFINLSKHVQAGSKIELSPLQLLGKTAYEILTSGKCLANYQIATMIVEYLRSLTNIKGWVLINFPENYEQAILIEALLTGTVVHDIEPLLDRKSCNINFLNITNDPINIIDTKTLRNAVNLPDVIKTQSQSFKTFLSSYIDIMQRPIVPVQKEIDEDLNGVRKFYIDQGCYYLLQYEILNITTIKYLAKMILNDYTLQIKNSLELFGEVVLSFDADLDMREHTPKSTQIGKEPPETRKKMYVKVTKPKSEEAINQSHGKLPTEETMKNENDEPQTITEDKEQQFPEIDETDVEIIYIEDEDEEEIPPKAGEPKWVFVDRPINTIFGSKLGTIWEKLEYNYIKNMKSYFFMTRCLKYEFLVYIDELRSTFVQLINRPDEGPQLLKDFQEMYNSLDPTFRIDDELKCELHYRIYEFKTKMLEIYTQKTKDIEQKRIEVIDQNYFSTQVINIFKTLSRLSYIDLDRCQNMLDLVQEYFSVSITLKPCKATRSKKTFFDDKDDAQINNEISNQINGILKNLVDSDSTFPINNKILGLYQDCERIWTTYEANYLKFVNKLENEIFPKTVKKNTTNKDNISAQRSQTNVSPEEKLFQEWKAVIDGEIEYLRVRLGVIHESTKQTIHKYLSYNLLYHKEIRQQALERLQREQQNIETIVEIFSLAVESENPLKPELDLVGDQLVLRPNILIHETISHSINPIFEKDVFTLTKVDKLVDIFLGTSPSGVMPEREFVFLLRDIITNNAEDGLSPLFPRDWQLLNMHHLSEFSNEIFFLNQIINWKDFILWIINCFPSDIQLLEARQKFKHLDNNCEEVIKEDDFYDMELWLDNWYHSDDISFLKRILFKMYRLDDYDDLLYMDMLLDFCKDEESIMGFTKAIELYLGALVCTDVEIGKSIIAEFIDEKFAAQEKILKISRTQDDGNIVDDIINVVLETIPNSHKRKSLVIPEIYDPVNISKYFLNILSDDTSSLAVTMDDDNESGETFPIYVHLSLDVIILVLATSLHSTRNFELEKGAKLRSDINDIYDQFKRHNLGRKVPSHYILTDLYFKAIINSVYRFTSVNLKTTLNRFIEKIEGSL